MKEYLLLDYGNGIIASIDHPQLFEKQQHTFLRFHSTPPDHRLNFIALFIADRFLGHLYKQTGKLKSDLALKQVHWKDPYKKNDQGEPIQHSSILLNYRRIKEHLLKYRKYDHKYLRLPELVSFWMDRSGDAAMNFYHKSETGEITWRDGLLAQQYGRNFPIQAQLNQEGILITSFLVLITRRIISLRSWVVLQSHLFHTSDWIFNLKALVNDSVSLLEITLNQVYLKAQYNPKETWIFDIQKLGKIHNRRLGDKLKWVKAITGIELNIEKQKNALNNIRCVRNHLNHFDPPVFSATLHEISNWLNEIMEVVYIVLMIRKCAGEPFNDALMELYLQPDVVYTPYAPRCGDVNHKGFGYDSVRYPTEDSSK